MHVVPDGGDVSSAWGCPPAQRACGDLALCVPDVLFCDGLQNCPNGFDEEQEVCGKTGLGGCVSVRGIWLLLGGCVRVKGVGIWLEFKGLDYG